MADLNKGKKKSPRKRITYNITACPDGSHNLYPASGGGAPMGVGKAAPGERASVVGTGRDHAAASLPTVSSPGIGNPYGTDFASMRVSGPVTAGHAAYSTGDHGVSADGSPAGRSPDIAVGQHGMNVNESTTHVGALTTLRTAAGDNQYGDRDITYVAGTARVQFLDAAGAAGTFEGMRMPTASPQRPGDHISRDSATPSNGTHSLSNPQSNYMQSMKSSSPVEMMKALQQRIG